MTMATIESYILPATLYRYRSSEHIDRELDAIRRANLYCATYSSLNDPMEGYYATSAKLRSSKGYSTFKSQIASNKATLGLCSFSEVHNNEVMWAHYADEFRGICIAYRFRELRSGLPENASFVRVDYRDKAPTVISGKDPVYLAKRVLSCKSYRWLYEREWRLFAARGLVTYKTVKRVQCVYLGFRMDVRTEAKIETQMKSLGIKTRKMSLNMYSLGFEHSK
jgi:Protein of unknown function (DUF2971)